MQENPKKKDLWDIFGIAGPLSLSVAIGVFSVFQYCNTNNRIAAEKLEERERLNIERVLPLLKSITSENKNESLAAGAHALKLCEEEKVACAHMRLARNAIKTYTESLGETARYDKNPENKETAKNSLLKLAGDPSIEVAVPAQKVLENVDPDAIKKLPARVYIHALKGKSLEKAKDLKKLLERQKSIEIVVPRINEVEKVPDKTGFRYFKGFNTGDVKQIQGILKNLGIEANDVDLSDRFPNAKVRPRHYEIWLAKQ